MSSRLQYEAACKNLGLAGCTDVAGGQELGRPNVDCTVVRMSRKIEWGWLEAG